MAVQKRIVTKKNNIKYINIYSSIWKKFSFSRFYNSNFFFLKLFKLWVYLDKIFLYYYTVFNLYSKQIKKWTLQLNDIRKKKVIDNIDISYYNSVINHSTNLQRLLKKIFFILKDLNTIKYKKLNTYKKKYYNITCLYFWRNYKKKYKFRKLTFINNFNINFSYLFKIKFEFFFLFLFFNYYFFFFSKLFKFFL